MAQRRMLSQRITNSGRFLKMPQSTQAFYFHLNINADDDGVVEAFKIMRMGGFAEDDLKILAAKNFIRILNEDLVTLVLDWNEHNLIRADRKVNSIYKDLILEIIPDIKLIKPKKRADTGKLTTGRPLDNQWTAQDRLGKVRKGKEREEKHTSKKENFNKNINYLINIPDKDMVDLMKDLSVTINDVASKGEDLYNYCKSKGKLYKDYKLFLRNALKRDFPKKDKFDYRPI